MSAYPTPDRRAPTAPAETPSAEGAARSMLAAAAASLASRLKSGDVPKRDRAAARAALTRAFEALEAEVAPPWRLVREVDALSTPPGPPIGPPLRPRLGPRPLRSAVDATLVDRIWAYGDHAARSSARIDAFLEATGAEPLRLFVATVRPGDRESPEMALTQG